MISKELLTAVLGFEVIPATGEELLKNSFGYEQGLRTSCHFPLKNDEWICIHNNIITFGFKDIRPEVIKNILEGVYTDRKINIFELAHMCKEWAYKNKFGSINSFPSGLNWGVTIIKDAEAIFENYVSSTEPESIFKACQWILENKK